MARLHPVMYIALAMFFMFVAETRANDDSGISGLPMERSLDPPALSPAPSEGGIGSSVMAEAPVMRATRRVLRHHSSGAAGGDVILGGFVMALVVVVMCYIRVTRKSKETDHVSESRSFESLTVDHYSRCQEENRQAIASGNEMGTQGVAKDSISASSN